MKSKDEISRLLGQFKLKDFPYRSFGREEPAASGGYRSTYTEQQLEARETVPEVAEPEVVEVVVPALERIAPLSLASLAPAAQLKPVADIVERSAPTMPAIEPVPRLRLNLELPTSPMPTAENNSEQAEPSLDEIFERLRQAKANHSSTQSRGIKE